MAGAGHDSDDAQILKSFLIRPLDFRRQKPFVEMCVRLATRNLRYFQARGWKLPVNQQTGGSPIRDLAIDMVGSLLSSKPGHPYFKVYDFYMRRGIDDFERADAEDLFDTFRSLLYNWVRQERSNLLEEEDPQKALLKRAFTDFFKTDEVLVWKPKGAVSEVVGLAKHAHEKREDLPFISFEELLVVAEETFHGSTTRRGWCRAIFDRLNDLNSVRNYVEKHLLLRAVVTVNMKYVDLEPAIPASPRYGRSFSPTRIEKAIRETLKVIDDTVLAGFITRGRLDNGYGELLLAACGNYLRDYAFSPGMESIPDYFREVMPEEEHARYFKDYKHVFETIIHRAREDFLERLRKNLH